MTTIKTTRKAGLAALAVVSAFATLTAFAQPGAAGDAKDDAFINTGYFGDVAIKGYDPVAYFTEHRAMKGSPAYSHRWLGATWHFASAEHRDLFAAEPVKCQVAPSQRWL